MATTTKWGVSILGVSLLGLVGSILLIAPDNTANHIFAQDATLVSSATDLHPVEVFSVHAKANSVQEAFKVAGVEYYPEDKISYFPDPNLGIGTVITVARALPVTVVDGKKTKVVRTWKENIGEVLEEKKILLGNEDRISLSPTTALAKSAKVVITRVARTEIKEKEVIPFETIVEKDYNQFTGTQTVLESGKNGEREKTYLLIREDGELISKTLIKTTTTVAAKSAKVRQGALNPVSAKCAAFKDWVVDAGTKNKVDPNALYYRMIKESNCNVNSQAAAGYQGLFQYDPTFWATVSAKAGHPGASIWDAKNQIYVTAWAWSHGYRSRWPNP